MGRPRKQPVEIWECPKCEFRYESPTRLQGLSHLCQSKQRLGSVRLRKVRGLTSADRDDRV